MRERVSEPEAREIVQALRSGVVPRRGLHHFAVGGEKLMAAIADELDFVAGDGASVGKGAAKWIRGAYGSGKTFTTRLLATRARQRGFATSEVQVSVNDTPLHHLETVYRRLIERLETPTASSGALSSIVDAWLYELGEQVTRLRGLEEDDPAFADATEERLEDKLADLSRRNPAFAQVLRAYHRAMHEGELAVARGLLAWLAGQPYTDRSILSRAGIKGKVDGQAALTFLAGLLRLLAQSHYAGLVVVLDEVETIQRVNALTREKSLNALRQLVDMLSSDQLPGLYLVITGTPDFFEGYKGLKSLPPLHERVRVKFDDDPRFDNHRAVQIRLPPFDRERLLAVGRRVVELYPSREPERVRSRVDEQFLIALAHQITSGFGGEIAVTPRLFLRELVDVLDRVDQHPEYDPMEHYRLEVAEEELRAEELAARVGGRRRLEA